MEVDLLFPGTSRTVVRLMEAWWDAKASTLQQGPTLLQIGLRRGHCCHKKLPVSGLTGCAVSNWTISDQKSRFIV
jgi:hypothetical protein